LVRARAGNLRTQKQEGHDTAIQETAVGISVEIVRIHWWLFGHIAAGCGVYF
jgi:hypothetical protein